MVAVEVHGPIEDSTSLIRGTLAQIHRGDNVQVSIIGGGPAGLYFALRAKRAWPNSNITVYECNRANDTFGFGLAFPEHALDSLMAHDLTTYESVRRCCTYWDDVDVMYNERLTRSRGNGYLCCSRVAFLSILQEGATDLGVQMRFQGEVQNLDEFPNSDLIVVADGIDSKIREKHKDHFQPRVDLRPNKFTWLGSTRPLNAFKYFFRESPEGSLLAHCYQYEADRSTWVIETDETTWRNFGFDLKSETEMLPVLERVFAEELDGHPLIANRSTWRNFANITNKTWVMGKAVLIGDAKAAAHFSLVSGIVQAMQDAVTLCDALAKADTIDAALAIYDDGRHEDIVKIRHAADAGLARFEHMKRYSKMEPEQFAFGVLSRAKQLTWEVLERRDPAFTGAIRKCFASKVKEQGFDIDLADPPMPMFTPFRLRDMVLENRVVVSPMDQYSAVEGMPTEWHLVHLGSRAIGGAGLVCVEMTCPSPEARISPGCTGLWSESQRDAFKRIVDFCHANSHAKLCMQLGHAGRKGSTQVSWKRIDHPLPEGNWPLIASSPIPYYEGVSQVPREMTRSDMDKVISDFVRSTRFTEQAGFDMLEIHMAHGYLFASFISPLINQRKDEYGGPVDNRMRFPLEVFRACREAWPEAKPMSVRISATDWAPGSLSGAELLALAGMLKDAGCDLIDCSTGQTVPHQKPPYGPAYQSPFSDWIRNEIGIATMTVGAITTPDEVNTLLAAGTADLIALARPHLSNPYFTLHAAVKYQHAGQYWPPQYNFGRGQVMRLGPRTTPAGEIPASRPTRQPAA